MRPRIRGSASGQRPGRTACACEPQLHVSAHAHQTCIPFRGFSHPYPLTKVAPSSSLSPTTPGVRGRLHRDEKWWRTEGRKRYPDADCLQSPRRQRQQQRLHAARLKVQPAAPGNTGVAGRADERRVPASWSPGLPKRPARKRKGSARTGAICWRSLGWLRRPGADGASAMRRRPRPPEAAARNRCRSRAAWASGQDRRRRSWGGWSSQASNAAARQACPTAKPAAARPTAFSTVLRLARAAMTCRPRLWDGQRVAPVVPPAGAEVVPAGTVDRGDGAERRVGGHGPDCGGSP